MEELNPNDPDYNIELFWHGLKKSMNNFYKQNNLIKRNITSWSNELNELKYNKKYEIIETRIRDFMSLYAIDIIRYETGIYHANILLTNIKRWNKISNNFNFTNCFRYNKILILFMIYLTLKNNNDSFELISKLEDIELLLLNNNFDNFIIYALNNNKPKILNLLLDIPNYNVNENIKKIYPTITITHNINMKKLCKDFYNNKT